MWRWGKQDRRGNFSVSVTARTSFNQTLLISEENQAAAAPHHMGLGFCDFTWHILIEDLIHIVHFREKCCWLSLWSSEFDCFRILFFQIFWLSFYCWVNPWWFWILNVISSNRSRGFYWPPCHYHVIPPVFTHHVWTVKINVLLGRLHTDLSVCFFIRNPSAMDSHLHLKSM